MRCAWIVLAAGLLLWGKATAQPGWSIEDCVDAAKKRNLLLPIARNNLRASELSRREIAAGALPQLKLGGALLYAPRFGMFGYDPAITDGGFVTGQVMLRQSVYDGGIRSTKEEQADVEIARRAGDIRREERDIVLSVRVQCLNLLFLRRRAELEQESARRLAEYLDLVKRLAGGGTAGSTDVLKTQIQLSDAQTAAGRTEQAVAEAESALKEEIGLPADTLFALSGTLEEIPGDESDSAAAKERAEPGSLDLAASDLEIARSGYDIELARCERYPTVAFVADAGLVTSGDNLRLPSDKREPMVGYSLGLSVELPLVAWGAIDMRIQQKQVAAENLRMERERLRRSFEAQSARLRIRFAEARERLRAAREVIAAAEDNFLLIKSKYAAGAALSLEVLSAQQELAVSRLAEAQALADLGDLRARADHLFAR